jgi:hypothetical protein
MALFLALKRGNERKRKKEANSYPQQRLFEAKKPLLWVLEDRSTKPR